MRGIRHQYSNVRTLLFPSGFTLLETLVAIGILLTLSTVGASVYGNLQDRLLLEREVRAAISALMEARERTLASVGDENYGVHFENDAFVKFAGQEYQAGNPLNETYQLDGAVEIYAINLGGSADIVYERVRGASSASGTVGFRLTDSPGIARTISVPSYGTAGLDAAPAPTGTRLSDSRHIHLDLGWSMQSASTLTLVFHDSPNPDVTRDITMADYFDAGQTSFDWEGSTTVAGEGQRLRLHTHELDAFGTELSIHRDRRDTTKAVDISIDGQGVVSYASDGTVTVGPFGGTVTYQ